MSPSRFPPSPTVHLSLQLHPAHFPAPPLLLPLPHPLPVADYADRRLSIQDEQGQPIINAESKRRRSKGKERRECKPMNSSVTADQRAGRSVQINAKAWPRNRKRTVTVRVKEWV